MLLLQGNVTLGSNDPTATLTLLCREADAPLALLSTHSFVKRNWI